MEGDDIRRVWFLFVGILGTMRGSSKDTRAVVGRKSRNSKDEGLI